MMRDDLMLMTMIDGQKQVEKQREDEGEKRNDDEGKKKEKKEKERKRKKRKKKEEEKKVLRYLKPRGWIEREKFSFQHVKYRDLKDQTFEGKKELDQRCFPFETSL